MRSFVAVALLPASCAPARPAAAVTPPASRTVIVRPEPVLRPLHLGRVRKVAPASRPGGGAEADHFARYNLDRINEYRAREGLTPLVLDARLSAFALEGSRESKAGGPAHGHFGHASKEEFERAGFTKGYWAENQGWSSRAAPDPTANEEKQIAGLLQGMMNEGSGRGHLRGGLARDPDARSRISVPAPSRWTRNISVPRGAQRVVDGPLGEAPGRRALRRAAERGLREALAQNVRHRRQTMHQVPWTLGGARRRHRT